MAEMISMSSHGPESRSAAHQERLETMVTNLIEYAAHNAERPSTHAFAQEAREAFHDALKDLLKELNPAHIEEVVEHLEERLKRGQHDLVVEFLSNLAKLQHADFAQEFLRFQTVPLQAQDDDVLQREAPRIGHTVIAYYQAPSIDE